MQYCWQTSLQPATFLRFWPRLSQKFFALGISKRISNRHHRKVHDNYCTCHLHLEQERYHGCCKFRYTQLNLVVQNTSKPHGKSLIHKKKSWSSYSTYVSLSHSLPPPSTLLVPVKKKHFSHLLLDSPLLLLRSRHLESGGPPSSQWSDGCSKRVAKF
jgi:hypothetical protein